MKLSPFRSKSTDNSNQHHTWSKKSSSSKQQQVGTKNASAIAASNTRSASPSLTNATPITTVLSSDSRMGGGAGAGRKKKQQHTLTMSLGGTTVASDRTGSYSSSIEGEDYNVAPISSSSRRGHINSTRHGARDRERGEGSATIVSADGSESSATAANDYDAAEGDTLTVFSDPWKYTCSPSASEDEMSEMGYSIFSSQLQHQRSSSNLGHEMSFSSASSPRLLYAASQSQQSLSSSNNTSTPLDIHMSDDDHFIDDDDEEEQDNSDDDHDPRPMGYTPPHLSTRKSAVVTADRKKKNPCVTNPSATKTTTTTTKPFQKEVEKIQDHSSSSNSNDDSNSDMNGDDSDDALTYGFVGDDYDTDLDYNASGAEDALQSTSSSNSNNSFSGMNSYLPSTLLRDNSTGRNNRLGGSGTRGDFTNTHPSPQNVVASKHMNASASKKKGTSTGKSHHHHPTQVIPVTPRRLDSSSSSAMSLSAANPTKAETPSSTSGKSSNNNNNSKSTTTKSPGRTPRGFLARFSGNHNKAQTQAASSSLQDAAASSRSTTTKSEKSSEYPSKNNAVKDHDLDDDAFDHHHFQDTDGLPHRSTRNRSSASAMTTSYSSTGTVTTKTTASTTASPSPHSHHSQQQQQHIRRSSSSSSSSSLSRRRTIYEDDGSFSKPSSSFGNENDDLDDDLDPADNNLMDRRHLALLNSNPYAPSVYMDLVPSPLSVDYDMMCHDQAFVHAQKAGLVWQSLVGQQVRFPSQWWNGARSPPLGIIPSSSISSSSTTRTKRRPKLYDDDDDGDNYDDNNDNNNVFKTGDDSKWQYLGNALNVSHLRSLNRLIANRSKPGRLLLHMIVMEDENAHTMGHKGGGSSGGPVADFVVGAFHPNARGIRLTAEPDRNLDKARTLWMAFRKRTTTCTFLNNNSNNDDPSHHHHSNTRKKQQELQLDQRHKSPLAHPHYPKKRITNDNMRAVYGEEPPLETLFVPQRELEQRLRQPKPALAMVQEFVFYDG